MSEPIPPALAADEWAHPEHAFERDGTFYFEPDGRTSVTGVIGFGPQCVGIPDAMLAPLIAVLNDALYADDPRKITSETVRAVLSARALYPLGSASHRELIQIAAVLAAYLPPDQRTPDLEAAYAAYR